MDGALRLPSTVSKREGCRGLVLVTVKRRRSVVKRRATRLSPECRYRSRFRIAPTKLGGRRGVTVAIRFRGNDTLGVVERVYPIRVGTR